MFPSRVCGRASRTSGQATGAPAAKFSRKAFAVPVLPRTVWSRGVRADYGKRAGRPLCLKTWRPAAAMIAYRAEESGARAGTPRQKPGAKASPFELGVPGEEGGSVLASRLRLELWSSGKHFEHVCQIFARSVPDHRRPGMNCHRYPRQGFCESFPELFTPFIAKNLSEIELLRDDDGVESLGFRGAGKVLESIEQSNISSEPVANARGIQRVTTT
ncbi:hypothetical protein C8R44DRAFT_949354 [Mycena epipterygia]|nr:hypothetical protein C8R44DRAFT_949354 [Mycena epipterygia]